MILFRASPNYPHLLGCPEVPLFAIFRVRIPYPSTLRLLGEGDAREVFGKFTMADAAPSAIFDWGFTVHGLRFSV